MKDLVVIQLKAGGGGHGRVSLLRERARPKGGPDGGNGGDGGDIILRAGNSHSTLGHLSGVKSIAAQKGEDGAGRQLHGKSAEPVIIDLPVGAIVWQAAQNTAAAQRQALNHCRARLSRGEIQMVEYAHAYVGAARPTPPQETLPGELYPQLQQRLKHQPVHELSLTELVVLDHAGDEMVICQGGFGGRGNTTFKNSIERTPLRAEWGYPGEERLLVLELKLLADVGLVGLPNAGKSTLLSVLTKARPKIANYPFTTLEPQLGVLTFGENGGTTEGKHDLVIADLPGIIEGASEGKGLGVDFLRHAEHCRQLVVVLAATDDMLSAELSPDDLAQALVAQLHTVQTELRSYHPSMSTKPQLVVVNKVDLLSATQRQRIDAVFRQQHVAILQISGATHTGLSALIEHLQIGS